MAQNPGTVLPTASSFQPTNAVAAMFANQAEWLIRNASGAVHFASPDNRLHPDDVVVAGATRVAIVAAEPYAIDEGFAWLRGSGSTNALIWSANENATADVLLHARGCRESFAPHWMWRDLTGVLGTPRVDADVDLIVATARDREALATATNVPYVSPHQISRILDLSIADERPRRSWLLMARRKRLFGEARIVGVGILHLSNYDGETIGGLYNLGVDPAWQGRGIGSALTSELCRIARDHGATGIALNATPEGERIYRQLDFVVTGEGQTWFLPATVQNYPPSTSEVAAAEALACGEIETLDRSVAHWPQMPNGESPIAFAVRFEQRDAVEWLIGHDADPDIVALWKIDMRAEAIRAADDPRWLNIQRGPEATTPLHEAIRRNDADLARLLIAAGADLTIRDAQWHGRPLDWANALGRPELAAIIQRAM